MIKNLLNADEEPPSKTKVVIEDSVENPPAEPQRAETSAAEEETSDELETRPVFEIPEDAKFFMKSADPTDETMSLDEVSDSSSEAITETPTGESETSVSAERQIEAPPIAEKTENEKTEYTSSGTLFQSEYKPPTQAETIRQSGLAYSAAIVLFGSVIFMMIFGWFADLLLGSSPWGIVGGIILGGIIGFIQFFRITSQIFKK
jgi:F0F1-type ATP synthase assembly protein I